MNENEVGYEIHQPNDNGMYVVSAEGGHIGGVKLSEHGKWAAYTPERAMAGAPMPEFESREEAAADVFERVVGEDAPALTSSFASV